MHRPTIHLVRTNTYLDNLKLTIEKILQKSIRKPERQLANGTRLVGPAPEIGPAAWYHLLFAPLSKLQIQELERELHQVFPKQLARFYGNYNGISLFGNKLNIWGKRFNWAREVDAVWQPFDMIGHNRVSERPKGSPYSIVYFGSIDRGDRRVLFRPEDGSVATTRRDTYDPEKSWPDFDSWLLEELTRLNSSDEISS